MTKLNRIAFFLVCLTVVVTTLFYGTVHQPTIAFFYLLIGILAAVWIANGLVNEKFAYSKSWLQLPLLALGVYGLLQVLPFGSYTGADGVANVPRTISANPFATETTAVHILLLCVFFAAALACLSTAGRLRRMAAFVTVFGFCFAFFAVLQSVLSPTKIYGVYDTGYATPFGSFVNRHQFAAFMEMAAAVPLGLLFSGAVSRDKRLLYIIAVILMGSSLMLSGSRGGLVAMLCEVILLVMLTTGRFKANKNLVLKIGLSILLIAAIVGGAIFVGGDTSLTRVAETAASQDVTSLRTHIWAVTLRVIGAHLPFGAGLGAFPEVYPQHDTLSGMELVEQSHNDYLQILADAGVVGLIIGGAFLFLFFKEGIRASRRHNTFRRAIGIGAFVGCTAILIHSLFDFVLHTTAISVMFLTMMALMVAAGRRYEDDVTEFDEPHGRRRRSASVTPIHGRPA